VSVSQRRWAGQSESRGSSVSVIVTSEEAHPGHWSEWVPLQAAEDRTAAHTYRARPLGASGVAKAAQCGVHQASVDLVEAMAARREASPDGTLVQWRSQDLPQGGPQFVFKGRLVSFHILFVLFGGP